MTSREERELNRYAAKAIALSKADEAPGKIEAAESLRVPSAVTPQSTAQLKRSLRPRGSYLTPTKPLDGQFHILRVITRRGVARIWKRKDPTQLGRLYYRKSLRPADEPPARAAEVAKQRYDAGCAFRELHRTLERWPLDSTQRELINNSAGGMLLPVERAVKARNQLERVQKQLPATALRVLAFFLVEDDCVSTAFAKARGGSHLKARAMPLLGQYLDQLALVIGADVVSDGSVGK